MCVLTNTEPHKSLHTTVFAPYAIQNEKVQRRGGVI